MHKLSFGILEQLLFCSREKSLASFLFPENTVAPRALFARQVFSILFFAICGIWYTYMYIAYRKDVRGRGQSYGIKFFATSSFVLELSCCWYHRYHLITTQLIRLVLFQYHLMTIMQPMFVFSSSPPDDQATS